MAGCGTRKKAMGGKIKMKEGGTPKNMKGFSKLPEAVQQKMSPKMAKKYEEGGEVKKGYHKMPDGKLMKDSDHKKKKTKKKMAYGGGVKKMKNGGKIDGCAMRGKTKGRMV